MTVLTADRSIKRRDGESMRERDFRCFALFCFTLLFLCVCALTEWCLG